MDSSAPLYGALAMWGYGAASVGFGVFAIQLALGSRGGALGRILLAAIALSSVWAGSAALYAYSGGYRPYLVAASLADALRIVAWCAFLVSLLSAHRPVPHLSWKSPAGLIYAIAFLALGRLVFDLWPAFAVALFGEETRLPFGTLLGLAVIGLTLVEQVFRNTSMQARWGIKPLCLGVGAAFCFDIYLCAEAFLFNRLNPDLWASRGIVNVLIIPLIALSAARNKTWTLHISVSRQVVFHSTTLFASGIYLLAIAGAGYYVRYFGGTWGGALQALFLFAGLLVLGLLFSSGSVRSKLRVLVNKHFYNYRYDYRAEWLRFTNAFSSVEGATPVTERAIQSLADLVESNGGALWWTDGTASFRQVARLNAPAISTDEQNDSPLSTFFGTTRWIIDLDEHSADPAKYGIALPEWLEVIPNAWLMVPLFADAQLLGFVVLLKSRAKIDVNWEVLDLLKTAAHQAATYLANIRATEALLEARKFESFNRMSAFVVHDVKNLVAQLSLLLRNAEKHKDKPEFQADMLMTIDNVVERMKQLLLQLRAGPTPVNQPRPVNLVAVLTRIVSGKTEATPRVTMNTASDVCVMAHEERIERVIGHLAQNAIDATPVTGKVWLTLRNTDDIAVVEIGDTGHGMSPHFVQEQLFKPFRSTKPAGMGIGAYESFQYVREIGGKISVKSEEGVGTVVIIELPVARINMGMATAAGAEA